MSDYDSRSHSETSTPIHDLLIRADVLWAALDTEHRAKLIAAAGQEAKRMGGGFVLLSDDAEMTEAFPDPWLDADMDTPAAQRQLERILSAIMADYLMPPRCMVQARDFVAALCEAHAVLRRVADLPSGVEGVLAAAKLDLFRRARGELPWLADTSLSRYLDRLPSDDPVPARSLDLLGSQVHGFLEQELARRLGVDPLRIDPTSQRRKSYQALEAALHGNLASWVGSRRYTHMVFALRDVSDEVGILHNSSFTIVLDDPFHNSHVPGNIGKTISATYGMPCGQVILALGSDNALQAIQTRSHRSADMPGGEDYDSSWSRNVFTLLLAAPVALLEVPIATALLRARAEERGSTSLLHSSLATLGQQLQHSLKDVMDRARLLAACLGSDPVLFRKARPASEYALPSEDAPTYSTWPIPTAD